MTNNEDRVIKVRLPFRILGGLICVAIAATFVIDFHSAIQVWIADTFNLAGLLVVFPLFGYCALFGKMPELITKNVPEAFFRDWRNAESFFTEFNVKSIAAAIVTITMIAYVIYKSL
jgi:hypothetical protein